MEIVSINVGLPQTIMYQGKELVTGIYKYPVSSSLRVSKTQLDGDGQADLTLHGGTDKALCVYPEEHYAHWEQVLAQKLEAGTFGENLTVRGLLEDQVCIGDIYAIDDVIVQVSQPRQPCHKLAKRLDWGDAVLQVQETGYTGYYLRVLTEGVISKNAEVKLIVRDEAGVTVAYANQIKYHEKANIEAAQQIAAIQALSASWKQSFLKRLAELGA
ncbi:MOSC domain-containing protein [Paenibacillus alginolyticus]|uniref:MOSC domain-containing protein n=1 Tax=Paenibacillus alginolyticus TaxID=59839 RepID=A0ABT4GL35_9BACL|nr:MOSC domain-containing protein [Paenibacillus alginolyticus]MCY9696920.1 MOSC domain-containing protein [Paenibacillus alginolyticus]MEC0145516.1 MOSC domain-containing protein [Paenibacillus alginolyticus]